MPTGQPAVIVVAQPAKRWWQSKLLMLNALVLIGTAAETQLNILQPLLPVNIYAVVAFALPALNAVLRMYSNQAIAFRAQHSAPVPMQPTAPPPPAAPSEATQ